MVLNIILNSLFFCSPQEIIRLCSFTCRRLAKCLALTRLAQCLHRQKPVDRVFDPFLGSGTTAVVARQLGRHYCGVEINKEYCLRAAKRLLNAQKHNSIQGYTNGIF
ncbi:MAG: site-specific DNA-methyltransferase [Prevotella sp.]|nr:site-specific DNA-methyltransferase [Prevotella sp.]